MGAKRVEVSYLLDDDAYDGLKRYAAKKGLSVADTHTPLIKTALSRLASLDKYEAKKPKKERPVAAKKTKAKAVVKAAAAKAPKAAKSAAKAVKKAAKKAVAKATPRAVRAKATPQVSTSGRKNTAAIARIAPQRPAPQPAPVNGVATPELEMVPAEA